MTSVEDLFAAHAAAVLAYALRRTDRASAEDVVSEVFLVAGRRPDRVPEDEPVLWLYGVARRVLANQRRSARRRAALHLALGDLARGREATVGGGETPLLDALARLRAPDREVLMLTAWEGLDAEAAGVVLGCSAHAVHARLSRARARLRAALAEDVPALMTTEARP